jgi:membrane fusion protein, multidrug efflux system
VAVTSFVVLAGCGTQREEASTEPATATAAVPVTAVTVAETDWPSIYEATGTVKARTSAQISSRVMAYVREVRVRVGDHVAAGQTLIVLDAKDLEAREQTAEAGRAQAASAVAEADQAIVSARANLDLAQATFRRMKDLHDKKSISNQEFDEATTRQKLARANLDMALARRKEIDTRIAQADAEVNSAKIQTGYATVTVPFAGVVTEKSVDPGNLAVPGATLLTIEQQGGYRLEVTVGEDNLSKIRLGQSVEVRLDSLPRPLNGRVAEIVPAVDPASRSFTVKIDLPANPELRAGMFGRARFAIGKRKVLAVPAAAITQKGQMQWVYVDDHGTARSRLITLGERQADNLEALSGLSAGERVISPLPANVTDGTRLQVTAGGSEARP